jgi:hypothetical protein
VRRRWLPIPSLALPHLACASWKSGLNWNSYQGVATLTFRGLEQPLFKKCWYGFRNPRTDCFSMAQPVQERRIAPQPFAITSVLWCMICTILQLLSTTYTLCREKITGLLQRLPKT